MAFLIGFEILWIYIAKLAIVSSLQGGTSYEPKNYPYMVMVEGKDARGAQKCIGIIDNERTFITASKCVDRSSKDWSYTVSTLDGKLKFDVEKIEQLLNDDQPSVDEQDQTGTGVPTVIPTFDAVMLTTRNPMNVSLVRKKGDKRPLMAPWTDHPEEINRLTLSKTPMIVLGAGGKGGAVELIIWEYDCLSRLELMERQNDPALSDGLLMSTIFGWRVRKELSLTACIVKSTASVGNFPPALPCNEDLGAPIVYQGSVWGIVIGTLCQGSQPLSIVRLNPRSWNFRYPDGKLPDTDIDFEDQDSQVWAVTKIIHDPFATFRAESRGSIPLANADVVWAAMWVLLFPKSV